MTSLKDKYIRFDWAIKRLLRQKANFDVLEGFLTVFLGQEITIVEILESEGNQETVDDKFNRVDVKARNSKGDIIIIEIQNTSELYYLERILYGASKAVTEHIRLGDTYREVKKVYSISILYFDLGIGSDYLYIGENNFIGVHTNDKLIVNAKEKNAIVHKNPADIFPTYYLIRVNNFNKYAVTPLEEWVDYLKNGVIREETTAPGLQEARNKLLYYSMSDAERHAYDEHINAMMIQNDVLGTAKLEGLMEGRAEGIAKGLEEGRAKGIEEGRAKGLEEGRAKGIEEGRVKGLEEGRAEGMEAAAKKMLLLNIPTDTISEITGLTVDDIERIKQGC